MRKQSPSSSFFTKALLFPFLFVVLALILFLEVFHIKDLSYFSCLHDPDHCITKYSNLIYVGNERENLPSPPFSVGEANEGCDIFRGRWVSDDSLPLYEEQDCPYIERQVTCQKHGRPDKGYQRWRWQPHGCSLPSFNATLMLESLRGKKLMFVGDSINRNQFFSLVCLVNKVIPDQHAKHIKINWSEPTVFVAKEYNATFVFYWAPYLLRSNADPNLNLGDNPRLFRNGTIDEHGVYWKTADILIFNSYLWWKRSIVKLLRQGSFDDEVKDTVLLPTPDLYRIAISSLIEWLNKNIDPMKQRVFFNGQSTTHSVSSDWGGDPDGSCYNETTMTDDIRHLGTDKSFLRVLTDEFRKLKVPVTYLNITHLTSYRKDAHTSVYNFKWTPLTEEEKASPVKAADCIHWCLPGVPDTWNEILFWKVFYP